MRRTSARLAVVVFALAITAPGIAAFICHPDPAGTSMLSLKGQVSAYALQGETVTVALRSGGACTTFAWNAGNGMRSDTSATCRSLATQTAPGRSCRRAAHDRARRSARPPRRAGRRRSRHELVAAADPRPPRHAPGGRRARGVRQPRSRRALGHPARRRAHDVRRAAAPRRPAGAEHERRRVPGQHGEERSEDDDAPEVHPHPRAPARARPGRTPRLHGRPDSARSRPTGRASRSPSAAARTAATASSSGTCRGASSARSRSRPA